MVKIGFICEGRTETMILNSVAFKNYCSSIGLKITLIINAGGNGNLLPHRIDTYVQQLNELQSEHIIILTDMDKDICITQTKERIKAAKGLTVIIAVKQIESWFLAATSTFSEFLNYPDYYLDFPENEDVPFETVRSLMLSNTGRGIAKGVGGKKNLAHLILAKGFSIEAAAAHPHCPSAAYLLQKLAAIAHKTPPQ